MDWAFFAEQPMRPGPATVAGKGLQDSAQARFSRDHNMIETSAPVYRLISRLTA